MTKNVNSTAPNSQTAEGEGESPRVEELQATVAELLGANQDLDRKANDLAAERDALLARLAEANAKLQAAAMPTKSGNAGKGTHVRVCSKSAAGSHRRAGRVWTTEPVDVPLKDLSNEQLAQLRSCPMTIVVDL